MGPNCETCGNNITGKCKKDADRWNFCTCGCGGTFQIFTRYSSKRPRVLYSPSKCGYRCKKKRADYGEMVPISWRKCDVCGEDVPVFSFDYQRMHRKKVACSVADSNCATILANRTRHDASPRGPRIFTARGFEGGESGIRSTYCHQREQCGNYTACLGDLGDFREGMRRYAESGGKCYTVPAQAEYGLKAINPEAIYA